jgi:nitrogen fixation protein FixH
MSLFSGPLTGRKVGAIFLGAFGTIIAANLTLLYFALGSFPGIEVKNTYADSMGFEQRRSAQETLHWQTAARFDGSDVILSITDRSGQPVYVHDLNAVVGLATLDGHDNPVDLLFSGSDYRAPLDLPAGNWQLRLVATAQDGTAFRQILPLIVRRN